MFTTYYQNNLPQVMKITTAATSIPWTASCSEETKLSRIIVTQVIFNRVMYYLLYYGGLTDVSTSNYVFGSTLCSLLVFEILVNQLGRDKSRQQTKTGRIALNRTGWDDSVSVSYYAFITGHTISQSKCHNREWATIGQFRWQYWYLRI